jgi:pimeloyl-ACP methyl ester carboxylesterase
MSATSASLPLILLPGMGTNGLIFQLQKQAFPQLVVPPWIMPERHESLADYAVRFAASLDIREPCVLGGLSFGGLVALELTKHLPARGCILISSLRGRRDLPYWASLGSPIAPFLPTRVDRWVAAIGRMLQVCPGPILPREWQTRIGYLAKTQAPLLGWACRAVTSWRADATAWPCPVYQLHGARDWLFPCWRVQPDEVVPTGGHHLPLTHPFAVNAFLTRVMADIASMQPTGNLGVNPASPDPGSPSS